MKKIYIKLFCFYAALLFSCLSAPVEANSTIIWHTDYEAGAAQAKEASKPMLLFFTGSDWCSWCSKLEKEVLDTPDFAQRVANRFVFVKLDFPRHKTIPSNITAVNAALQKRYNIQGFPTIVLLDSNEQKIGQLGYRAGGGKQYSEHLLSLMNGH